MARISDYEEKKEHHKIRITQTAWNGLEILAKMFDVSRSEVIERLGRGAIAEPDYRKFLKKLKEGLTD